MPSHRFAAPLLPKMRGISGTPYLQEDEPKAKSDWLRATAKEGKFKCVFHSRSSIPYGKGKAAGNDKGNITTLEYQFPMGKVKASAVQMTL